MAKNCFTEIYDALANAKWPLRIWEYFSFQNWILLLFHLCFLMEADYMFDEISYFIFCLLRIKFSVYGVGNLFALGLF